MNVGKKVTGKKVTEKKSQIWVGKKVTGNKVTNIKSFFFYIVLEIDIIFIITNIMKNIFVLGSCFTSRLSFFGHASMELMLPKY